MLKRLKKGVSKGDRQGLGREEASMRKAAFSSTNSFPRLRAHSTEDEDHKHALFKDYQIGLSRLLSALCWPRI